MSKRAIAALGFAVAIATFGCTVQQPTLPPDVVQTPAHPLPFKGRLFDGNLQELPPAVAMSLSDDSPVTFSYREELTHDESHKPLWSSAFDPATYAGSATGQYGVTAFASLSISEGDTVLADYTAQQRVTMPYSLFAEPTHKELDQAARNAVRTKIDQQLYGDAARLAEKIASSSTTSTR
ncbi:MAG: hypothetical protein Q7S58_17325 [Candidatus Binatus sp.]|uniref:hypothetical protein n=1 Tax=Candidatus Binatus sp. TaxID=2811406 RepID=UPI00272091FD|nr:hypothetical protein [Candidatus Binatus sp.]MDO8434163.1 hypothetical protein [Candidatus Binatus sp.]